MTQYYVATKENNEVVAYGESVGDVGMSDYTVQYFDVFEDYQSKLAEYGFNVIKPTTISSEALETPESS
jgi:hypothetical protein